jgi:hypothetical protein
MRVRVPIIVKDPEVTEWKGVPSTEPFVIASEEVFLDGPITPRVAILDFDAKTGQIEPPVPFAPPAAPDKPGTYTAARAASESGEPVGRQEGNVSVFGTVLKTLAMFEEPDALGRRIVWAFDAPQLLVVPRAGEWANAFYERESHGLQFFYFTVPGGGRIHTAHSQDIVAHETAHAILDGIAPDLYHAYSPQALAIHEAVADLTALLSAFRSRTLAEQVLRDTNGSIASSTAFTGIAEQFAGALRENRPYLRDLANTKSLSPRARPEDRVDRSEPHDLSEVLSGALYRVMVKLHESLKDEFAGAGEARASLVEAEETHYQQAKQAARDATAARAAPPGVGKRTPSRRSSSARSASSGRCTVASTISRRARFPSPTSVARSWPPTRPRIPTAPSSATGSARSSWRAASSRRPETSTSARTSSTRRWPSSTSTLWSRATGRPTPSRTPTGRSSASRGTFPSRCGRAST